MSNRPRASLARLRRDERGDLLMTNMAGIVVQMLVLAGLATGIILSLLAFTNLAATNAVTSQLAQADAGLRDDVRWASDIPVQQADDGTVASPTRFTAVIVGVGAQDGCKESTWSIEDIDGDGEKSLVLTARLYSSHEVRQVEDRDASMAYSDAGMSVCTGQVRGTEKTVVVNQVGDDARFRFYNAGGAELTLASGKAPVAAKAAAGSTLGGMDQLRWLSESSGLRIASVELDGKVAAGTDREVPLRVHQSAEHLEAKPVFPGDRNTVAEVLDPMTLTR